jgi:ABC-type uncharacterized transport system substrate-binding protein
MRRLALIAALVAPAPALAHPHVFVDVRFGLVFDAGGQLSAVKVHWSYDELFSLMLVEDEGADRDQDGALSAEEAEALRGFDMDWSGGFPGDTWLTAGGAEVALTPGPQDWETGWRDGRLWSVHTRTLAAPLDVAAGDVVIRAYDPGYYVAYAIDEATEFEGRGDCRTEVWVPDLDAAQEELLASLKEYLPGDDLSDAGFPEVGEQFAEELRLTCSGR